MFRSPLLWGLAATGGFYACVRLGGDLPQLAAACGFAERYLCGHPLEYVLVGMFFIGMATLLGRRLRLRRERAVLSTRVPQMLAQAVEPDAKLAGKTEALDTVLNGLPSRFQQTVLVARFRDASEYLKTQQSARGLEGHLKYLADKAADALQDSYSLLLTINWAVPMIGFLGTVIGITLAIANVTPEQLDTSLTGVTGGLAVAFDTTAVALSLTLVLVFGYVFVKHREQQVHSQVEQISLARLLPLFVGDEYAADPMQQAQADAARQLLDRTDSLIRDQTDLWRDSMDGLRQRWAETVDSQQQELSQSLHSGVESTLSEHAGQLAEVRREFLNAFESASTQLQEALEFDAARRDQQDAQTQAQQQQLWDRIHQALEEVLRSHDARTEDLLDGLGERMQQWQTAMEETSRSVEEQLKQLNDYTGELARLSEQGEQLGLVERQLSENLAAVRAAETFEETLHNLTAAVHMLTARAKPRAA